MDEDYGEGFKLASYPTPCCGARFTLHELVRHLDQPHAPCMQHRGHREFHAELGFQSARRPMAEERIDVALIAADLDISQRTVEIHRARVMEKLHANSLAHLVRMVLAIDPQVLQGLRSPE